MLAAALALPTTAHAAAFVNGSFEDANVAVGGFTTFGAGSTAIEGWTVGSGSIDYVGTYWQAGEGSRSLDLSGGAAGSIWQTFDTVAGQLYSVTFMLSGNPEGPPPLKTIRVEASGATSSDYSYLIGNNSRAAMGWETHSYIFTANSTSTTLSFTNVSSNSAFGPALDNVTLTAVPEPASWALMIGGFALAGGAMRRRTARALTFSA
jgi:choice-of-anchor C domain-containing protein